MTTIFTQNYNFNNLDLNNLDNLLSLQQHLFPTQLEIIQVLIGPLAKNQYVCRKLRSEQFWKQNTIDGGTEIPRRKCWLDDFLPLCQSMATAESKNVFHNKDYQFMKAYALSDHNPP